MLEVELEHVRDVERPKRSQDWSWLIIVVMMMVLVVMVVKVMVVKMVVVIMMVTLVT